MEIPSWFGVDEYYWLLRTIIIVVWSWLFGQLIRARIPKTTKEIFSKIKLWYMKRKSDKELLKPYKPAFKEDTL